MTQPPERAWPIPLDLELTLPLGDVVAARSAVIYLTEALIDPIDPPSDYLVARVKDWLGRSSKQDATEQFETLDEAVIWLMALRDRLSKALPEIPTRDPRATQEPVQRPSSDPMGACLTVSPDRTGAQGWSHWRFSAPGS